MRSFPFPRRLGFGQLLVAGATLVLPAVVAAQPTAVDRAASSQNEYRQAHEAARSHNWLEARRILLGLWARAKTYDVAASLSEAEFGLGHNAASAQYMDYALRHVTPNESAATVANMKSALEKLRPKVGVVSIVTNDPSAMLSLDGAVLDYDREAEIFVEPGAHVFQARSGDRTSTETLEAVAGTSQVLTLELPQAGATPATALPLALPPSSDTNDTAASPRTIALLVGGALAVGGLGTGIGFGVSSNSSENDASDYRARVGSRGCASPSASSDCQALQDAVDSQRRKTHVANIGYGVAAVGLVTVGVALLWPRSNRVLSARASQLELRWSGDAISLGGQF
jgi:hypothetical protein